MWGCLWIVILITTCASFSQESVPLKIDMAAIRATATLYPDVHGDAKAKYSIDGDKRIGSSGASGRDKCASTRVGVNFLVLRYLKVDLGQMYYVSTITLHLRDNTGGVNRRYWQNGLAVELTNSSNGEHGAQCGGRYNAADGQSPTFPCSKAARYILITLRRSSNPVQICEVEAFGEVRGCKDPNNLPNGKYEISQGRGFGSRVTFTCNIGYKLQGKNTAHCQRPGKWSVEQPSCQPIPCKTPVNPRNGSYQLVDNRKTYGSRVLFQCNPNYHLSGQNTAQCQADGTWSPSNQPLCIAHCEASEPVNGYVVLPQDIDKSRVLLMTYVTYKCHNWDGYVIEGDYNVIQCKRPGRWSDLAPTCSLANCGNPENPVNGTCTATKTTYGSKKTCSCNHGYRLRDPSSATTNCQIENFKPKWRGPTPSCQLVICDDLSGSRITYGKVIFNGQLHGNTTEYKCNEGYELIGDVKRECQRNDSWSGKKPSCKIKMCKGLSHPPNGAISSDSSRPYGSIVSYTCNSGYELQYGSSVRKCLAIGQWSGLQPICQESGCSNCHRNAECVANSYCHCKSGYVGNGKHCCPEGMGGLVTITGATAHFRCDSSCNISIFTVTWYKDGAPISSSQNRYGLANNDMLLYLENLTADDTGEYACQVHIGGTTFKRFGNLEVLDVRKTNLASSSCSLDCGKSCSRKPFVAEGVVTHPGQFPWQAMLCSPSGRGQYCGGVLVSPDCLVTAAHCVVQRGVRIQNITACLGRHCGNCSESDSQGNPQCSKPRTIVVHPQFDEHTLDNDIAVMKLRQPASLHCDSVFPVCLPDQARDGTYIRANKHGLVTGWGKVNSTVSRSRCLRKGRVRLASPRICRIRHYRYNITSSMMCATDNNGACEGDSGGPLVVKNLQYGGRYVLAGIVSWGIGCGEADKLGVYTSVLNHLKWIKNSCAIHN